MPARFVIAAKPATSLKATPSASMNCRKLAHIAWETSQGPPPEPVDEPRVVESANRCSNSLSNSIVKATSTCDSSVGRARREATTLTWPILANARSPAASTCGDVIAL